MEENMSKEGSRWIGDTESHHLEPSSMGKYVWAIATKKDNLFVKWIHNVYLVNESWWEYEISPNSSWFWKQVVEVKNAIKERIDHDRFVQTKYQIKWGCELVLGHVQEVKVEWSKMVWERISFPRHRFIVWLTWLGRLRTKDVLAKIGVSTDQKCMMCGDIETIKHLFFECQYSKHCLESVMQWLDWKCDARSLGNLFTGIQKAKCSSIRKRIVFAVLNAVIYNVWRVRNEAVWESKVWMIKHSVQRIKSEMLLRVKLVLPRKTKQQDREWVEVLCTK